jgi:hypothetical protein
VEDAHVCQFSISLGASGAWSLSSAMTLACESATELLVNDLFGGGLEPCFIKEASLSVSILRSWKWVEA